MGPGSTASDTTADTVALRVLGRGVVVNAGGDVPQRWTGAPRVVVDEAVLADPADAVGRLHRAWVGRRPVVVEVAVDPARFRAPESITGDVWAHTPLTEPWFDRLHFLVWSNNYDARTGEPIWWWSTKASRIVAGSTVIDPFADEGDLRLADGRLAWIDGGPRQPWDAGVLDAEVIHSESVELGRGAVLPPAIFQPPIWLRTSSNR